jgi:hypothetical protein
LAVHKATETDEEDHPQYGHIPLATAPPDPQFVQGLLVCEGQAVCKLLFAELELHFLFGGFPNDLRI